MLELLRQSQAIEAHLKGHGQPLVVHRTSPCARPYLHPLMAPDGIGAATEDVPPHHPWQHGLYFGLNDVNGVGFWTEGLHGPNRDIDGSVVTTSFAVEGTDLDCPDGERGHWSVTASWRDPGGLELLRDRLRCALTVDRDRYWIDLAWHLAAQVDVRFGQYDYGGLFLRMPVVSAEETWLQSSSGATIPGEADGRRARWMALAVVPRQRRSLDVHRQPVCIAVMDHSDNPEHPVPWRADSGFGIAPSRCIAGAWSMAEGESVIFRHRVLVTIGPPDASVIDESHRTFATGESC